MVNIQLLRTFYWQGHFCFVLFAFLKKAEPIITHTVNDGMCLVKRVALVLQLEQLDSTHRCHSFLNLLI